MKSTETSLPRHTFQGSYNFDSELFLFTVYVMQDQGKEITAPSNGLPFPSKTFITSKLGDGHHSLGEYSPIHVFGESSFSQVI